MSLVRPRKMTLDTDSDAEWRRRRRDHPDIIQNVAVYSLIKKPHY